MESSNGLSQYRQDIIKQENQKNNPNCRKVNPEALLSLLQKQKVRLDEQKKQIERLEKEVERHKNEVKLLKQENQKLKLENTYASQDLKNSGREDLFGKTQVTHPSSDYHSSSEKPVNIQVENTPA